MSRIHESLCFFQRMIHRTATRFTAHKWNDAIRTWIIATFLHFQNSACATRIRDERIFVKRLRNVGNNNIAVFSIQIIENAEFILRAENQIHSFNLRNSLRLNLRIATDDNCPAVWRDFCRFSDDATAFAIGGICNCASVNHRNISRISKRNNLIIAIDKLIFYRIRFGLIEFATKRVKRNGFILHC